MHVRHNQVVVAVEVVVTESDPAPQSPFVGCAAGFRDVGEIAVSVVFPQSIAEFVAECSAVVVGDVDIGIAVAVVVVERHAGAVQPDVGDPALRSLLGKTYRNARLAGFVALLPGLVARLASTKQDPRGYRNGADAKTPFH